MHLTAGQVAELVNGRLEGAAEVILAGAEVDSRRLAPGYLFVALAGARCDGHSFVEQALTTAGAALVRNDARLPPPPSGRALIRVADPLLAYQQLATRERRQRRWQVVAVTGSVGKTTTKDLLVSLLQAGLPALAVGCSAENRNSMLGLPAQLLNQPEQVEVLVAEAGMSLAGELDAIGAMLQPEVVLYTRLAPVHTEFFNDGLAGVVRAKGELLRHLSGTGTLIINGADPHQQPYADTTGARVLRYGEGCEHCISKVVDRGLLGSRFQLRLAGSTAEVELPLAGAHQRENLLAAATAASVFAVTAEQVAAIAPTVQAAPHRGRLLHLPGSITVVDDSYNASPVAVGRLLELLAAAPGRRLAVLGEMYELGHLCHEAHRQVGVQAAAACDLLITVGGGPAKVLAEAARAAGLAAVHHSADAHSAAALVSRLLKRGDVVLVKGSRGVGLDQTVAMLSDGGGEQR